MEMRESIFKKIKKLMEYAIIALAVFIFGFSDFVSFLPEPAQKNQLAENFTIKKAQAAPPVFVAAGAQASNTSGITPALPSGIAIDDILLLFLETANQAIAITNQNGGTWTEIVSSPQGTGTAGDVNATRLTVFWSRYNGTQGAPTTSDSGNHQIGIIVAIRGSIAAGDPFDVMAGGVEAAADTSGVIPGAITSVDDAFVVAAAVGALPDANTASQFSGWINASLTNIAERFDVARNSGNGGSVGIVTGEKAVAGSYSNTNLTYTTSTTKAMISIALKPVPVGPAITSASANSGQIGAEIIIAGSNFGAGGTVAINGKAAAVVSWGETSITARIPGQAPNLGKIQVTRAFDGKTSNLYPSDPSNFSISGPSVSSADFLSSDNGQSALVLRFTGAGIDTDGMPPGVGAFPVMKLKNNISGIEVIGTSLNKIADYAEIEGIFDLTAIADADAGPVNSWNLIIINPDLLQGAKTGSFTITTKIPTISAINPNFGLNTETISSVTIIGTNFDNDASGKLKLGIVDEILSAPAFIRTDSAMLNGGSFNLSGKTAGFWDAVVVNNNGNTATKGNGFEIRSSLPTAPDPNKLYQFKASGDDADPPSENIEVGGGISGQNNIYFRVDMSGGTIGDYYPQVEIKPVGAAFDGIFTEGDSVGFTGAAVKGWVNIASLADGFYHWQARVRNSAGTSGWVPFGGNNDPNDRDVYIDNALPEIYQNIIGDDACLGAAINITDLSAVIRWNTSDDASGAQNPPGSGSYAKVQVDFKKGFAPWIATPLSAWENSLHQVALSGLVPAAIYTFRMSSQDYVGNERISPECNFTTTSSRPIKTVEFFIGQEASQNAGGVLNRIVKGFSVYFPESPDEEISVKSAFIEVSGISSDGAQAINAELRRGLGASFIGTGTSYNIDSAGTTTPFVILFDALNPNAADGNESMADITQGAASYDYTLFLSNAGGVSVSAYSAKLIITYSYSQ